MPIAINKNNRESDSYIGTFDVECASDMLELEEVKAMVRNMNRDLKKAGFDYKFRVCLRGRKPAKKMMPNPSPWSFIPTPKTPQSYNYFGNIVGGIANATKIDAYIYRRR